MKWFLLGSACFFCTATLVRGDAAADLYNKAAGELDKTQYDDAAKDFDTIVTNYPTNQMIDDVRLRAGLAYLYSGKFSEAVDRLTKEIAPDAKPQYRGPALYFTSLAQFSLGQKNNDKSSFTKAVATLTTLIDLVTKSPTPDTQNYLESGIYYRSLAEYELENYDAAEKDLIQLTTSPKFSDSLTRPDYFIRLGGIYAQQANLAVAAKKPDTDVLALAQKALDTFDQVSRDPNALVQANDANMSKAQVYFLIAPLSTPTDDGYQKALDAFRLVHRKADLIPAQQDRLAQLQRKAQAQAQANAAGGSLSGSDLSLLINREQNRLKDLQNPATPDPIVQALLGIAECYVALKQPDEARTIMHRLVAHATLTPEQQQTVDFQTLYSYVLGGQTDAANKALDAYLSKHTGDPQADFISYSIAADLAKRKDYENALKQTQRSLKDFPQGKYAAPALGLEAEMLNKLGRGAEADKVIEDFVKSNPTSPIASTMLLTKAQTDTAKGDLKAAADDYKKVRDNSSLSTEIQGAAGAGYIQTLSAQQMWDQVITEAKTYQTKFPGAKAMASVLLFSALAMDQKHDPGAVAALQDIARKYPQEEASPFALSYVVTIYSKATPPNLVQMTQAANDLQKAYPEAYPFLQQAADTVSTVLIKNKKFDDAAALFKPLASAPKAEIATAAQNKIGDVWLASAKTIHYQSLPVEQRPEADKRLAAAEEAYTNTLKNSGDQLAAVGDAFDGLANTAKVRRSWGLLKDADLEGYLDKTVGTGTGDIPARLELAKAGLVFVIKDGVKQYAAALDRIKKVIATNPNLRLTRQETDQFGDLLLDAKDFSTAETVYGNMLQGASPNDRVVQADAFYGLGATALGQGDLPKAKDYFMKLKALPGGGLWQAHIAEANFGVALADEQSSVAADNQAAMQTYGQLMQNPGSGGVILQAKSMLGYGRLLEKAGYGVKTAPNSTDNAVRYYTEPHTILGPATPEQSAEGLYDAAQTYQKAGDAANAKKMNDLLRTYNTTAPDWAAKAQ